MSDSTTEVSTARPIAPPLAPISMHDILRVADALRALMGKESLGVVAELANTLTVSAHDAGAREIEEAASNVRRLASCRGPVVLAGAMRALTDAITRTESAVAA
jgi:HAMP domain-containing protein